MKTKKQLLTFNLLLLFLLIGSYTSAQPDIQWQKTYGGSALDQLFCTSVTTDGGYVLLGKSSSTNGDITSSHGGLGTDMWLVKTDANGNLQWQKSYGGTNDDRGYFVKQTSDKGFIMIGNSSSSDGDVTGNHGTMDMWIVKTDSVGTIQWQKSYGGTGQDWGTQILQNPDGTYIAYGVTLSNNGNISGNHGSSDEWVLKLDAAGNIIWQKCYGGTYNEGNTAYDIGKKEIFPTSDGGYFISGTSSSNDGDVTGHHGTPGTVNTDAWVFKIDSMGVIQWQKSLGGTGQDKVLAGSQTADGGYIITGGTNSTDGDVTGHIQAQGVVTPTQDVWVVKLNPAGNIQWAKCIGLGLSDCIEPTADGGYVESQTGLVIKIDSLGNVQWRKRTNVINATTVFQTADLGYIFGGYKQGSTTTDYYLTKLSPISNFIITGNVYEDLNHNCIKDSAEVGLSGRIINAMPGNYFATTDANGDYSLFVDSGLYTISHVAPIYYNQSCPNAPATYTATINSTTPNSFGNNFADTLTTHCADLKISIGGPFLRRCFRNNLSIQYTNAGAVAATNVTIVTTFNNATVLISSSVAGTHVGNIYTFTIDTLKPGQTGTILIVDSVSCGAVIGTQYICTIATIHTSTIECDTTNNSSQDCHTIIGSCDPNGKEVATTNTDFKSQENCLATDTLNYLIRFQNTGTDTAFTVIVRDTLSTKIDAATIESGASSHPYSFRIYGQQILEWTFDNIKLPDSTINEVASHGFVKFTVRQKGNNSAGTIITNSSNIVFDYNAPVLTDTAVVTIYQQTTQVAQISSPSGIYTMAYPNPANNEINIKSDTKLGLVAIYNLLGEMIFKTSTNLNEQRIDLNKQAPGVYIIQTENARIKIIKE